MKSTLMAAVMLLATVAGFAQDKKAPLSPRAFVKDNDVDISYGQPSMRGREIFGKLVPYGEVWRTGANEATEITFKKNATFAGKVVPAGIYTLFTIPAADGNWTVILNKKLKQWGSYEYEKVKDQNILMEHVHATKLNSPVEKMTIMHEGGNIVLEWEKTKVDMPISTK